MTPSDAPEAQASLLSPDLKDRVDKDAAALEIARNGPTFVELESLEIMATTETPVADQAREIIASGQKFRLTILATLPSNLKVLQAEVDELLKGTAPKDCQKCDGKGRGADDKPCEECKGAGTIPGILISDTAEFDTWNATKRNYRALSKRAEEGRKEVTRPLDSVKTLIMDLVRPILEGITALESRVDEATVEYRRVQRQKDADRAAASQESMREWRVQSATSQAARLTAAGRPEEAAKVVEEARTAPLPAPRLESSVPESKGVSYGFDWEYFVEDEALVPKEYWIPATIDEKKIAARVDEFHDKHGISGVLAWQGAERVKRTSTKGL
jgi:hypothetical protein